MLNLSISYRPARTGLLVRSGNLDDLIIAVGLNTLLAGGIYNPIIPISEDTGLAEKLIERFNVDALYAVADDHGLHAFREKYPFLVFPFGSDRIFLEDWETKKNVPIPLDVLNVIEHYWEEDFRHKPDDFLSNCVLIKWTDADPAKHLLAVTFGFFPSTLNLRDNFARVFLSRLRAREIELQPEAPLDPKLTETVSAIGATSLVPRRSNGGIVRGHTYPVDGIVIGDEYNFDDLAYFWNLRAAGFSVEFLPLGATTRFRDYIQAHLDRLDRRPSDPSGFDNPIAVHVHIRGSDDVQEELRQTEVKHKEAAEMLKSFHTKKTLLICPSANWTLTHGSSAPATFYYDSTSTLANVDKTSNGYSVTLDVRDKPVLTRPRQFYKGQELIITISPVTEFAYEHFTLKFPFIHSLNRFFSAKATLDPHKVRLEKDGAGVLIDSQETSLTLFPVSHEVVIKAVLEYAGIQAKLSNAGLITKRILEKLGGLREGRVFKVRGVRQLIHNLKKDDSVLIGDAKRLIQAGGQFKEHEKLFGFMRKLTFSMVFETLLKKDIFRAGLEMCCNHCGLKNWLSLRRVDDFWPCAYCGHENQTSLHLKKQGEWRYRKSGLFSKDNNQEGAIPVILTLFQFESRLKISKMIYTPALNLTADSLPCETDFCILHYGRGKVEVGIGECKSEKGLIEKKQINDLLRVREKLGSKGLECYLIFSKTADVFSPAEIGLFHELTEKKVPCILFTNRELEPYEPYDKYSHDELPYKHAMTFREMAFNSTHVYLKREPKPQIQRDT